MKPLLVVVDMQIDFISGALGTKEAETIVPAVIQRIREFPGDVVYTRDTHGTDYLSTQEGKHLPVVHCISGTAGWEIHPDVLQAGYGKTVKIIDKPTFGSQALCRFAETENYDAIELIGLCTDICVISNAMLCKAAFPEANIVIDAALCACVTPESHDTALNAMRLCQMEILHQGEEPWRK